MDSRQDLIHLEKEETLIKAMSFQGLTFSESPIRIMGSRDLIPSKSLIRITGSRGLIPSKNPILVMGSHQVSVHLENLKILIMVMDSQRWIRLMPMTVGSSNLLTILPWQGLILFVALKTPRIMGSHHSMMLFHLAQVDHLRHH
jgi:hypothetical protein